MIAGLGYEEFVRLLAPGRRSVRQQERLGAIWRGETLLESVEGFFMDACVQQNGCYLSYCNYKYFLNVHFSLTGGI